MGILKNIMRFLDMSHDDAISQFIAFELSIEYKIENNLQLDENEMIFYFERRDSIARSLGITKETHKKLRNEMKDTWQFVLKRQ